MINKISEETKQRIKESFGRGFEQAFDKTLFEFGMAGYSEQESEELAWRSFLNQ